MAPEGEDPAPRPPDVAEQELDDRRGPDVLDADAVLRPADGVDECRGPVAPGVGAQLLSHSEEERPRDAAGLLDGLRGVAGVVALEDLVHAAGVLEGRVPEGRPARDHAPVAAELVPDALARPAPLARGRRYVDPLVAPARGGVDARFRIEAP